MTIIETMKAFLSGVSGYLLQFYAKEDGADKPNKVMSVASDGLILHNSDEENIPLRGNKIYEVDPGFTEITEEQELFIDGTSSVVTSDGREPISGYAGGTYIPPTVNIDGVEYPNPSWYDGTSEAPVAKARGCYGFYEAWENVSWRDVDNWGTSNASLIKEGDWLKATSSSSSGFINYSNSSSTSSRRTGFLLKKGEGDTIYFGTTSTVSSAGSYTFSTGVANSVGTNYVTAIKLSDTLAYITYYKDASTTNSLILFENSDEYCYISEYYTVNDISFMPPFGQDGLASSDNRAYNFDKWDQPISFTFKPQFDYDDTIPKYIFSDTANSSTNVFLIYGPSNDQFLLRVVTDAGNNDIYFSKASGSWEVGTSAQTAYTDNEDLQVEVNVNIFIDTDNNELSVSLDGETPVVTAIADLDTFAPSETITLGGLSTGGTGYGDTLITNFCVHPKTQTLPVTDTFTDPNKQYGKNAQWFLDQFGNTPYGSMLSSAGGVVEEGSNVNGSWVRFENGLLVQWTANSGDSITLASSGSGYSSATATWNFPVTFTSIPFSFGLGNNNTRLGGIDIISLDLMSFRLNDFVTRSGCYAMLGAIGY